MHRLTATDTPMVRYTRTIFPSYALFVDLVALSNGLHGSVHMDSVASPPWNTQHLPGAFFIPYFPLKPKLRKSITATSDTLLLNI